MYGDPCVTVTRPYISPCAYSTRGRSFSGWAAWAGCPFIYSRRERRRRLESVGHVSTLAWHIGAWSEERRSNVQSLARGGGRSPAEFSSVVILLMTLCSRMVCNGRSKRIGRRPVFTFLYVPLFSAEKKSCQSVKEPQEVFLLRGAPGGRGHSEVKVRAGGGGGGKGETWPLADFRRKEGGGGGGEQTREEKLKEVTGLPFDLRLTKLDNITCYHEADEQSHRPVGDYRLTCPESVKRSQGAKRPECAGAERKRSMRPPGPLAARHQVRTWPFRGRSQYGGLGDVCRRPACLLTGVPTSSKRRRSFPCQRYWPA